LVEFLAQFTEAWTQRASRWSWRPLARASSEASERWASAAPIAGDAGIRTGSCLHPFGTGQGAGEGDIASRPAWIPPPYGEGRASAPAIPGVRGHIPQGPAGRQRRLGHIAGPAFALQGLLPLKGHKVLCMAEEGFRPGVPRSEGHSAEGYVAHTYGHVVDIARRRRGRPWRSPSHSRSVNGTHILEFLSVAAKKLDYGIVSAIM